MTDIKSPEARSENMSRIRSKDTKPEEYTRKLLFNKGYRYRKNEKSILGHPDAWFPKYRTALFVNGCFWHRHKDCRYAYVPKSRVEFWEKKFNKNIERDMVVREGLAVENVKVLIVWECTVNRMRKDRNFRVEMLEKIERFLNNNDLFAEL